MNPYRQPQPGKGTAVLADAPPLDPNVVELAQRARMILDVAGADLEAAEEAYGAFDPTSLYFRSTLEEARRSWERLQATWGTPTLTRALEHPPGTVLTLNEAEESRAVLIVIGGQTYRVQWLRGAVDAPAIRRLTRIPSLEDGPYHCCRLADGTFQCDCAQWIYQIADTGLDLACKHLAALQHLGWI